jgi:hypothetical protein
MSNHSKIGQLKIKELPKVRPIHSNELRPKQLAELREEVSRFDDFQMGTFFHKQMVEVHSSGLMFDRVFMRNAIRQMQLWIEHDQNLTLFTQAELDEWHRIASEALMENDVFELRNHSAAVIRFWDDFPFHDRVRKQYSEEMSNG